MTDIAELGIRVSSEEAEDGAEALSRLTVEAGKAERGVGHLGNASAGAAPKVDRMGRSAFAANTNVRVLTRGLSDVARQAAATGDVVGAVQGRLSMVGRAFGPWGIALGAIAGNVLPDLIGRLFTSDSALKQMQKTIEETTKTVSEYRAAVSAASAPMDQMIQQYGALSREAKGALDAIADVKRAEAISAVAKSIKDVLGALTDEREYSSSYDGINTVIERAIVLKDTMGMMPKDAADLRSALEALGSARGLENQGRQAREAQAAMLAAYKSVEAMPEELRKAYIGLGQVVIAAGETATTTQKVEGNIWKAVGANNALLDATLKNGRAASGLAGTWGAVEKAAWAAAAAARAAEAARQTRIEFSSQAALGAFGPDLGRFTPPQQNTGSTTWYWGQTPESLLPPTMGLAIPQGSGGGGGGGDGFKERAEALRNELLGRRQVVDEWYQEGLTILADRRAQEILGEQGHKDALLEIERLYQQQLAEIQGEEQQRRLAGVSGFFGAMAGLAQAGGARMVKAAAVFGAIQGTIDAYGAYLKALNSPVPMTPWARAAAALNVLAAGLKGVQAIRAAGGTGGGGSTPVAQGAAVAQPAQSTLIVQGLRRDDLFTGQQVFDMFMGEAKMRNMQVVFR